MGELLVAASAAAAGCTVLVQYLVRFHEGPFAAAPPAPDAIILRAVEQLRGRFAAELAGLQGAETRSSAGGPGLAVRAWRAYVVSSRREVLRRLVWYVKAFGYPAGGIPPWPAVRFHGQVLLLHVRLSMTSLHRAEAVSRIDADILELMRRCP